MGYRSNVAYVIAFRDTDEESPPAITTTETGTKTISTTITTTTTALQHMKEFVAVVMAMGGAGLEALKECNVNWFYHTIAFEARDVKWYEDYPEVQAHHKLMKDAEELHHAAWIFNGVGEDDEHETNTDEAGYGYDLTDWCRVCVELEMNYKTEPVGDALRLPDEPETKNEVVKNG